MGRKRATMRDRIFVVHQEYRNLWEERYGKCLYKFTGRERTRLREIIEGLGLKETKERLRKFFADKNEWLVSKSHAFGIFLARIDQYRRKTSGTQTKEKITRHKTFDVKKEIEKRRSRKDADS